MSAEPAARTLTSARAGSDPGAARQRVIEVHDLHMSYGSKKVLTGVNFEVYHGEVFCLLGPNGAGKTTTIEILEGFRTATKGTARVLGFDPAAHSQAMRERIGVVMQESGFPRYIRVHEMLEAWRMYYPNPKPLHELLDVVGLKDEEKTMVRRLSGGQKRRLDFALALAGDPDLIFLDEPTTGFDPEARLRSWAVIENLRSLGKAIMLTTHYLDEAEHLADRVAVLVDGVIDKVGTPQELARESGTPTKVSFTLPAPVRDGEIELPEDLGLTVADGRAEAKSKDPSALLSELLAWAAGHELGGLPDLAVIPPSLQDAYLQLVHEDEAGQAVAG
jgi:ABC-2 type transport system ATP-binding protein